MRAKMKVFKLENRHMGGYVTWGSLWKRGELQRDTEFCVYGEKGMAIPSQSRITAFWPDGTIKWAAHTADSAYMGETAEVIPEKNPTESRLSITKLEHAWKIESDRIQLEIPERGREILKNLVIDGTVRATSVHLVAMLERREASRETWKNEGREYYGESKEVILEEWGPVHCVVKVQGIHRERGGAEKIPFILRMILGAGRNEVSFVHTFLYDGKESIDFLKGIGMRFFCPIKGALYNRHIKFGIDHGMFHECVKLLYTSHPPIGFELYQNQMDGKRVEVAGEKEKEVEEAASGMPAWDRYSMYQDSPTHFIIQKKVKERNCCKINALHGYRAPGYMAFGGENGGLMIGRKDFWQKYPSGFWVEGLESEHAEATVWFWAPEAGSMDFRHYAVEGYAASYYEGFPEVGADPYGIANTNEFSIKGFQTVTVEDSVLKEFGEQVQKPPVYFGEPEYYHERCAFGYWGTVKKGSQTEVWLESQLKAAVQFYKKEIDRRNWYGLFDYGDVMHSYDRARHCWRYDMGGFAWHNTELVPTMWLWYMFLRTGDEETFTMAEAMSRHCAEVDVYHMGRYKGLGSRHNVRHWGCSCKEARIAMAGHHRFYYYLTGDYRMGEILEEVKDADQTLVSMDPLRYFYDSSKRIRPTHARSGPDWSSFCSNWMTQWERFQDKAYEKKIRTGISDLKKTPMGLISGPDFEYDPDTNRLYYIGERTEGGTHLQICMGAAQIWMELADLMDDEGWRDLLAEYGKFYFLSRDEQERYSEGRIGNRMFTLPYTAASVAAYASKRGNDAALAQKVWGIMFREMKECCKGGENGIAPVIRTDAGNQRFLPELPWISTGFVAQWCLNVIVCLDLIRDFLPQNMT